MAALADYILETQKLGIRRSQSSELTSELVSSRLALSCGLMQWQRIRGPSAKSERFSHSPTAIFREHKLNPFQDNPKQGYGSWGGPSLSGGSSKPTYPTGTNRKGTEAATS